MLVKDKMWQVQQPGTILRARHSARRGQLALVLTKHITRSGERELVETVM